MRDAANTSMIRPAYILAPQATNPIPLGSVGEWLDLNGQQWKVFADGSQRPISLGQTAIAPPCDYATAAALPAYTYAAGVITANANGALSVDGKAVAVGDRILKVTAGGATDDGIYTVTAKGAGGAKFVLTRASDMSTSTGFVPGMLVSIGPKGATLGGNLYELITQGPIVMDTTVLEFAELVSTMSGGVIPSARCAFSVDPANNDTIVIGADTYTFKTALGAAGATTQVTRGNGAATTLASLINAINGVADATVVPATVPPVQKIVADAVTATVLRIRKATAQGGNAVAGTVASTALAATITGGAAAWSVANLNVMGRFPSVTITAAMVTNGSAQIELDYAPSNLLFTVKSSAGVLRSVNEAVTKSGNTINLVLAGGASPNFQATDVFDFLAAAS